MIKLSHCDNTASAVTLVMDYNSPPTPYPLCESKFTRASNGIKPPPTALKGQGYLPAMDMEATWDLWICPYILDPE